ncbi:MAG TPA: hypothetical protein VGK32_04020 [Vicinamibacterales bacterium]|jgi:hypothetical protein
MVRRREFVKAGAAMAVMAGLGARAAGGEQVGRSEPAAAARPPQVHDRLDQGPFRIDQDEGWFTIETTTPSLDRVRNFGMGLVGYTWEENGPALAVRSGAAPLDREIEKLAALPFVDVLYIRCDWRDVQSRPGRLDLPRVWPLTFDAARRHGLRVGVRVQMSNPEIQPARLAIPDFLKEKVPLVQLKRRVPDAGIRVEPRYDHPAFQRAFRELQGLLAAEIDDSPLIEFVDLMMYGFWGEGHTSDWIAPFPDKRVAQRTFVEMTQVQLNTWRRAPLVVNTQPDISGVGNDAVLDLAVRSGCWLRSDSVILDEPIQIDELSNRPPWLAAVMEDGYHRHYRTDTPAFVNTRGAVNPIDTTMLHVLDLGGNYWSLWTEADNVVRYRDRHPEAFAALDRRLGYRVRPSWIWQRKRQGRQELIVAVANDGVAGVPGNLCVFAESEDGKVRVGGGLDAGHPHAGRLRHLSLRLPEGVEGSLLRLRAELDTGEVRRPVRWACSQPLNADGSLTIRLLGRGDPAWRKGI